MDSGGEVTELTEPLVDLLGTLFNIDEGSEDLSNVSDIEDAILDLEFKQDSVSDIDFLRNFFNNRIACLGFSLKSRYNENK